MLGCAVFVTLFGLASCATVRRDRADITITKGGKPLESVESRIIAKDSNFMLTCQLDDTVVPTRSILWAHNEATSPTFSNVKLKHSPRKLRIYITAFSSANVGFYSCKTSDAKARGSRRVRLLQQCPTEFNGYCLNGGDCVWDGSGVASCFCAKKFLGKRCEKVIPTMSVIDDKGKTPLTIMLSMLSVVLLMGVILGLAAIRYRFKRSVDLKSRFTCTTNTVKVAAVCAEYTNTAQNEPLILDSNNLSSGPLDSINSEEDDLCVKKPKKLQRADAVEEV